MWKNLICIRCTFKNECGETGSVTRIFFGVIDLLCELAVEHELFRFWKQINSIFADLNLIGTYKRCWQRRKFFGQILSFRLIVCVLLVIKKRVWWSWFPPFALLGGACIWGNKNKLFGSWSWCIFGNRPRCRNAKALHYEIFKVNQSWKKNGCPITELSSEKDVLGSDGFLFFVEFNSESSIGCSRESASTYLKKKLQIILLFLFFFTNPEEVTIRVWLLVLLSFILVFFCK